MLLLKQKSKLLGKNRLYKILNGLQVLMIKKAKKRIKQFEHFHLLKSGSIPFFSSADPGFGSGSASKLN